MCARSNVIHDFERFLLAELLLILSSMCLPMCAKSNSVLVYCLVPLFSSEHHVSDELKSGIL